MKIYIYGLFDARKPDEIRYVGQSQQLSSRFKRHQSQKDAATREWVSEVQRAGFVIGMKILEETTVSEASGCERKWVNSIPNLLNTQHKAVMKFGEPIYLPLLPLQEMISQYTKAVVDYSLGNQARAARILKVSRITVRSRLNTLGFKPHTQMYYRVGTRDA